jgi:hypothetical protein
MDVASGLCSVSCIRVSSWSCPGRGHGLRCAPRRRLAAMPKKRTLADEHRIRLVARVLESVAVF